mmetsp:Transcript_17869/g.12823  ORF Transcript_17869/g.12823 Transcript_17869/m.12823 type:complete len:139 (-) Transcript_17869:510-926(-)
MLDARDNIIEYPCKDSNRTVPYFRELDRNDFGTVNEYMYHVLKQMNLQKMVYFDYNYKVKHREELPDGAFTVYEASEEVLSYKMQINDYRVWQYHRNNGVTKIGFNQEAEDPDLEDGSLKAKLFNTINDKERKDRQAK